MCWKAVAANSHSTTFRKHADKIDAAESTVKPGQLGLPNETQILFVISSKKSREKNAVRESRSW